MTISQLPRRRVAPPLVVFVLVGIVGSAFFACSHEPVARTGGGVGLLPIGASAPDVVGVGNGGKQTRLSDVHGNLAVVYFYPKDETPGCTHEACAFRDAFVKYETRHVAIFGVSRDSEESHREFRETHKLPFPLVADEDGSVAQAYGVPSSFRMTKRVTFLIGAGGQVAHVWENVDPAIHSDEILRVIDSALAYHAPVLN
jgi:thioredoxin-dependent peroxiredoxin